MMNNNNLLAQIISRCTITYCESTIILEKWLDVCVDDKLWIIKSWAQEWKGKIYWMDKFLL